MNSLTAMQLEAVAEQVIRSVTKWFEGGKKPARSLGMG